MLKGITEELGFKMPSKIQSATIPVIIKTDEDGNYEHFIGQAHNGTGKTGSFAIGSLLRVDPNIKGVQVIVLTHVRELAI